MKILLCIQTLNAGGKERRLIELLKQISNINDLKCEILIMSHDIHYNEIFKLDIKINYFVRRTVKNTGFFFDFYKVCKKFKPDIIHCWDGITAFYALPISKILKIKLINSMISDAPTRLTIKKYIYSRITMPFSDIILSNSYAGLQSYKPPKKKNFCIHNGFDFSRLKNIQKKNGIKKEFNIKTEKIVGMVASFSESKDYKTFILAAQKILLKNNNVTFLAIGDGYKIDYVKKLVKIKQKEKIKFLGRQNDVESIINIFDIGVLSTFTEGISNSIIEYMALEKPVIATRCAGTEELVKDYETGYLINQRDVNELVSKIEMFLKNETIAKKMGKKGKEIIKNDFNLINMVENTLNLYKSILKYH